MLTKEESQKRWLTELKAELERLHLERNAIQEEIDHLDYQLAYLYAETRNMDYVSQKSFQELFSEPAQIERDRIENLKVEFDLSNSDRIKGLMVLIEKLEQETRAAEG